MKLKDNYPEFVPSHSDMWALANHYLHAFLAGHFVESFLLGTLSGSTHAYYDRFQNICELLGDEDRAKMLREADILAGRNHGDAWEAYKYRFPDLGFLPANLDAVVRYAQSIPEEQWGVTSDQALTPDLEAALRAAVDEKATGKVPEWASCRSSSPPKTSRTRDAEEQSFMAALERMDG